MWTTAFEFVLGLSYLHVTCRGHFEFGSRLMADGVWIFRESSLTLNCCTTIGRRGEIPESSTSLTPLRYAFKFKVLCERE